jgi:hypothetical protein
MSMEWPKNLTFVKKNTMRKGHHHKKPFISNILSIARWKGRHDVDLARIMLDKESSTYEKIQTERRWRLYSGARGKIDPISLLRRSSDEEQERFYTD